MSSTVKVTPVRSAAMGKATVQSAAPAIQKIQLTPISSKANVLKPTAAPARIAPGVRAVTAKLVTPTPTPPMASLPPSYKSISPAYLLSTDNLTFTRAPNDNLKQVTTYFSDYEKMTSMTSLKPEIVMLSNFLPFYRGEDRVDPQSLNAQKYLTAAAQFFDVQAQIRELRVQNVYKAGSSVGAAIMKVLAGKKSEFQNTMSDLLAATRFLLTTLQKLETLKSQFDLRNDIHSVDASMVSKNLISRYIGNASAQTQNQAKRDALDGINKEYDLNDLVVGFGFSPQAVLTIYASTKLWLQMLYEFKQILTTHSLNLLDLDTSAYTRDLSPVKLTKPTAQRFTINPTIQIFDITTMVQVDPAQLDVAINSLNLAYDALYSNVSIKSYEQKMAAQCVAISREFRYSRALSHPDFQQQLSRNYAYTAQPVGNQQLFDKVIGQFGNDITDINANFDNSLVNLAHTVQNNVGVLTFENQFLSGDYGSTTPGTVYYVDSILNNGLKFRTENLQELTYRFDSTVKNFGNFINELNLLMFQSDDNTFQALTNPRLLFENIAQDLVDMSTGQTKPAILTDKLGSIFAAATQATAAGKRLKSSLFMLTMARIMQSQQVGSKQLIDALNQRVLDAFKAISIANVNFSDPNVTDINDAEIKDMLSTQNSVIYYFVIIQMTKIYFSFKNNDLGLVNARTRYGGHIDTVLMMLSFDLLLHAITRYSNQSYSGAFQRNAQQRYQIRRTFDDCSFSINDVESRLEKEVAFTKQAVYGITNTLTRLRDSATNVINYMSSPSTLEQAVAISQVITDPKLLNILTNEQQIMMLNSTVTDFNSRLNQVALVNKTTSLSFDNDKDFDEADIFTVIDDGVVTPKLKSSVMSFLAEPAYLAAKGVNKKIMSVGIPVGFVDALKRRGSSIFLTSQNMLNNKQTDVINVCVFKIDLQHQDIVYKPQKFLFELSRFPVRLDTMHPAFTTLDAYINSFPTRDYTQVFESQGNGSDVQYLVPGANQTKAFDNGSYAYLTDTQKRDIIKNQVISFLLETYVRLMSGVSVSEHEFSMIENEKLVDDPVTMQQLIDASMQRTVDAHSLEQQASKTGVFFSNTVQTITNKAPIGLVKTVSTNQPSKTKSSSSVIKAVSSAVNKPANIASANQINLLTDKTVPIAMQSLVTLDEFSRMVSPLADGLKVSRRLLAPKKFERVFNVAIDPDDFVVDENMTTLSSHGKEALAQLISSGYIVVAADGSMKNRDKVQGDIGLDKYFVTIETTESAPNADGSPRARTRVISQASLDPWN